MSAIEITDESASAPGVLAAEPERPVAVSVDHISKTYPVPFLRLKKLLRRRFKPPVEALSDVSFKIREGEIFGLIGPNGAGKTTLTKIVATLVQPTLGSVTVKGYDSVREDEQVRGQVGLATAEERSFYWRLTAEQNLLFFARLYGLSEGGANKRIEELLNRFEIEELARRRFGELSTGNKQRLAVARAMLASPPVLLLDEPTRSLDPLAASRMRALIKSLASDDTRVTVLLTSHNLAEVEELCERVAIISKGSIRALDTPQSLRSLHTQTERVSITVRGLGRDETERALASVGSNQLLEQERRDWPLNDLDLVEQPGKVTVSFTRDAGDELLDQAIRTLQNRGARIDAVTSERATLLDVLESYEK